MIKYKWEIRDMNYVFRPSPIESPPFYIEPSRTFKFCLQLHPFGRDLLNDKMILLLWRCDSNERSIELTYDLRIDNSFGALRQNPLRHERYTYNFKTPMQFPESRVYLTKPVKEYEPVLKITCTIFTHTLFQDVDKDIMSELSNEFELLLYNNLFSNYRVQVENGNFYVYNAILEARCDVVPRVLNTLNHIDPTIFKSIMHFLYTGKLRTWTTNIVPVLMQSGNNYLLKTMYPFLISEYSAKTSFVGNCYSFDWVIENFMAVESENILTYLITTRGTVMQVSFFPFRENDVSNFSIEVFESGGFFIRGRVDIQIEGTFLNLVDMSNSESKPLSLVVNSFYSIDWIMGKYPSCKPNETIKLKIYIYMCSFDAQCTSNIDSIKYTNVFSHTMHMHNLMEDFKKLFHHSQYYDLVIRVNYSMFHADYERYRANYARFNAEYASIHAHFMSGNEHHASFPVHKAILSARSSWFRNRLSPTCFDTQSNQLEIYDTNPYVLHNMLLFMYCGQLSNLNIELAMDLNSAAYKYNILSLKTQCSKFLESNIRADNVDKIQNHANHHGIGRLQRACIQFRRRNINII